MMRWIVVMVLIAILGLVLYQVFELRSQADVLAKEELAARERLEGAINTRDSLKAELQIYEDPESAEKELRRRYNYRHPDEKMFIIIPEDAN